MSKKLLGVGVALALVASVLVGGASVAAQSVSCANIDSMLAVLGVTEASKVAQAKAALGCSAMTAPAYTFTRDLTVGSTGADVTALQVKLGVTPATGYFGPITKAAVVAYQTANGITPAAGYVGPITRAKLNASVVVVPTPTPGTTPTPSTGLSGGEASLEAFDLASGDDDDVEENQSAEIAEIEFDVEDGDVKLSRVDLALVGSGEEQDPWDAFEEARLLVDGKEIGSVDLSDEDNYLDEDDGTFRISGLNHVVKEGDSVTIVVELTAQNSVDGADDDDADWTLNVLEDGVRATDSEGIEQYIGDESEEVDFSIVVEGDGEELNVSTSNEDPESDTFKVEDDAKSDWYSVFAFDLEAEESDVELDSVEVDVETSATSSDMIDDLILVIDGDEFDDWSYVSGSTSTSAVVSFDIDGDYTVDADSEVTVVLKAKFKAANGVGYSSSTTNTIEASISEDAIEGEGADDVISDGVASGEEHQLAIAGIIIAESGFDDNTGTSANNDEGTSRDYEFTFTVTAFEEDFYIHATSSVNVFVEGAGTVATSTFTVESTGDEDTANVFTVEEGQTETFTVIVTISDVDTSGQYRVGLDSVDYTENSNGVSGTSNRDVNDQDFRTVYRNVNAL